MWPFSSKKKAPAIPAIQIGEIIVRWDLRFEFWEFSDGDFDYSFHGSPEFDVAVLNQLSVVKQWLVDLDQEIDFEIKKHLEGWCDWTGKKHVISIDVSALTRQQQVDIAFSGGEEWGDLGVNIVIKNGKIMSSYAGD